MELIIQSIKDLFSAKMLKYSLLPFIITALISYIVFILLASMGLDQLHAQIQTTSQTIQNGVVQTQSNTLIADLKDSSFKQFMMSYAITSWILSFMVYAIGTFFVLYASIFIAVLIIGFLTPYILKELQRLHYQDVAMIGFDNIFQTILLTTKWAFIMILLSLIFVPLYFIPVVNIIALNFPLYYFFHKMINYDIGSTICSKDEFYMIKLKYANELRLKSLFLYLISLIPFAIFFVSVLYVIYTGHTYFIKVKELRTSKIENSNQI